MDKKVSKRRNYIKVKFLIYCVFSEIVVLEVLFNNVLVLFT